VKLGSKRDAATLFDQQGRDSKRTREALGLMEQALTRIIGSHPLPLGEQVTHGAGDEDGELFGHEVYPPWPRHFTILSAAKPSTGNV
jgi:hypothetical protein